MNKSILLFLSAFFLLFACNTDNTMDHLNKLLSKVEDSTTVDAEKSVLLEIADFIAEQNISIDTDVTIDGEKYSLQNAKDLTKTEPVKIVFSAKNKSTALSWKSQSLDNIFVLFRE